ncbi:unknown [Clostridium sp. CAG:470]|jgi:ribosomal protein L30/L7E|nr:unknown [Clostridium sp. CAG:470]DAK87904.1 MAG TPA: hypothetical protein [Caudoviricetes sp.]
MALKNYTTTIKTEKTINEIQQILAKHKAKAILIEYGDAGSVVAISFKINTSQGIVGIRLPARQENVLKVLRIQKANNSVIKATNEQAERTAWRNIKDWIDAQMALIETEMVTVDEVFFPYILNDRGQTLYETFKENNTLMLTK